MIKKIELKEIDQDFSDEQVQDFKEKLLPLVFSLAEEILKLKNKSLDFQDNMDIDSRLFSIKFEILENFGVFFSFTLLLEDLLNFDAFVPLEMKKSNQKQIARWVRFYNNTVTQLEIYKAKEKEIEEVGFEKLQEDLEKRLIKLFQEMLSYKQKSYSEQDDFLSLSEKVKEAYPFYIHTIATIQQAFLSHSVFFDIESQPVLLSPAEVLLCVEGSYDNMSFEEAYKEYANYYREFPLGENETYQDLYRKEQEKLASLFKEMLDFVKVSYREDESFSSLHQKMLEAYPFYKASYHNIDLNYPDTTYIEQLDYMEDIYEALKKNYKNYSQNMKRYQEEKKQAQEEEEHFEV